MRVRFLLPPRRGPGPQACVPSVAPAVVRVQTAFGSGQCIRGWSPPCVVYAVTIYRGARSWVDSVEGLVLDRFYLGMLLPS